MREIINKHPSNATTRNAHYDYADRAVLLGKQQEASLAVLDAMESHHPDSAQFKALRTMLLDMNTWPASDTAAERQARYEQVISAAKQVH